MKGLLLVDQQELDTAEMISHFSGATRDKSAATTWPSELAELWPDSRRRCGRAVSNQGHLILRTFSRSNGVNTRPFASRRTSGYLPIRILQRNRSGLIPSSLQTSAVRYSR